MAKKTVKKKKRDAEHLWRKAIKQDDIQLAIDAAKFLGDHERLKAIAFEGWLKKQYHICEQAFRALGIELTVEKCLLLDKLLKQANGKRRTATLGIQNILQAIVTVRSYKPGIVFERSSATSSGLSVCLAIKTEETIAVCVQQGQTKTIPLEDAEEEWQVQVIAPMPDKIWPSFFGTWKEDMARNYKNGLKWAASNNPNLVLPLLPTEKIVLEVEQPQKKTIQPAKKKGFFEKVLEAIDEGGWYNLCKKTTRGQKQFSQFSQDQLAQIAKKLQGTQCSYYIDGKPLKKFPAYFANELWIAESVEKCPDLTNIDFLENIRTVGFSEYAKSEVVGSIIENIKLNNVEELFCSGCNIPEHSIEACSWLKNIKKLTFGNSGWPQDFKELFGALQQMIATLIGKCSDLEYLSISNIKVDKTTMGSAKLPKLRSFSFSDLDYSGVEALLKAIKSGQLKEICTHYSCSSSKALCKLLKSPKLKGIETIKFEGLKGVDEEVAKVLANSKHFSSLRSLTISSNWRSSKGVVETIATSSYLKNLRYINFDSSWLGEETIIALANWPHLISVETLILSGNGFGDAGFIALIDSPYTKNIYELDVGNCKITAKGVKTLNEESFPALRRLNMWGNNLNSITAARHLAQWPHLVKMEQLNVDGCLSKKGRELLCTSDCLQGVKLSGVPEYAGVTNWRKIKEENKEEIDASLKILAAKPEIVAEVKKQIAVWAGKFKINLDFLEPDNNSDCLCVSMVEIGNSTFSRAKKNLSGEPVVSELEYAICLLEEAKRQISGKYQEHLSKIYDTYINSK